VLAQVGAMVSMFAHSISLIKAQAEADSEDGASSVSGRSNTDSAPPSLSNRNVPPHRRSLTAAAPPGLEDEEPRAKPFEFDASATEFQSHASMESAPPLSARGSAPPLSARGGPTYVPPHRRSMTGAGSSPQVDESKSFEFNAAVPEFTPGRSDVESWRAPVFFKQAVGDDSTAGQDAGAKYVPPHLRMPQSIQEFVRHESGSLVADGDMSNQVLGNESDSLWTKLDSHSDAVGGEHDWAAYGAAAKASCTEPQTLCHSGNTSSISQALLRNGYVATPLSPEKKQMGISNWELGADGVARASLSYRERLQVNGSNLMGCSLQPPSHLTTPSQTHSLLEGVMPGPGLAGLAHMDPTAALGSSAPNETSRYVGTVQINTNDSKRLQELDAGAGYLVFTDSDGVAGCVRIPSQVFESNKLEVGEIVIFSVQYAAAGLQNSSVVPWAVDLRKIMKKSQGAAFEKTMQILMDTQEAAQAATDRADEYEKLNSAQADSIKLLAQRLQHAENAAQLVASRHKVMMDDAMQQATRAAENAMKEEKTRECCECKLLRAASCKLLENAAKATEEVALQHQQEIAALKEKLVEFEAEKSRLVELASHSTQGGQAVNCDDTAPPPPPIVKGALRRFLHASSNCEALSKGYLKVTQGDELVATYVEEEWFFGFSLTDPAQHGWFSRSVVDSA